MHLEVKGYINVIEIYMGKAEAGSIRDESKTRSLMYVSQAGPDRCDHRILSDIDQSMPYLLLNKSVRKKEKVLFCWRIANTLFLFK